MPIDSPEECLLDTTAAIALMRAQRDFLEAGFQRRRNAVSAVALGELLFGARNSGRREANLRRVEWLLEKVRVFDTDTGTAEVYAGLRVALQRKGRPIPPNDIWIAATALQHGLPLVTRDKHFEHIPELEILGW